MGLIEMASAKSVWRGVDYYEQKKVIFWEQTGEETYKGTVTGSGNNIYHVYIDKAHPKKSICDCPFADGRKVVCKHMIALYFTAEPTVAENFLREAEEWEAEEEKRVQQHYEELERYVKSMSKEELQERLLEALIELEERGNYYW